MAADHRKDTCHTVASNVAWSGLVLSFYQQLFYFYHQLLILTLVLHRQICQNMQGTELLPFQTDRDQIQVVLVVGGDEGFQQDFSYFSSCNFEVCYSCLSCHQASMQRLA